MTRKEAIFELIKYRRRLEEDPTIIFGCGAFDAEPFDMAIEALERKRGEWHEYDRPYHLHCCRNCGEDALFTKDGQEVLSNYCAFCGAEMRKILPKP